MNSPTNTMMETQAKEVLGQQDDQNVQPLQYTQVDNYTTFRAEFALDGEDLVFHFFLPPEFDYTSREMGPAITHRVQQYWSDGFPRALDAVAREFFKAEFPTLKAAYTSELKSWWLRANGCGNVVDPAARCRLFIARLDTALDQAKEAVNVSHRSV